LEIQKFDGFRVEIDQDKQRADLILSRTPLNVVLYSQRSELAKSFLELDQNKKVRIIVLRADGDHFSSGGNIAGFLDETPENLTLLAQNIMTPERIKKPVIAAIQGYCFGVGFELCLACDFRIVTFDSQLSLPEIKIGMIPGSGGSARLAKMIGISRAKNIIMRGKRLSGKEAYDLGIACEVIQKDALEQTVQNLVDELITISPLAQRTIKSVLNSTQNSTLHTSIELEGEAYGRLRSSNDFREGVESFSKKRKPKFTGS
jgi:Enoyl-CoA hydratase/carnithine racemase